MLVQSAPLLAWTAAARSGGGSVPAWLRISSNSAKPDTGTVHSVGIEAFGATLPPGDYSGSITLAVDHGVGYPGDGQVGRVSSSDLLPITIRATLTVQAPSAQLSPSQFVQSVLPGTLGERELYLKNAGSGTLHWRLALVPTSKPPAWLAVCNSTATTTTLDVCAFGALEGASAFAKTAYGAGSLLEGVSGVLPAGAGTTIPVVLKADSQQSGLFIAQLQLVTNEFGPASIRSVQLSMRATLVSAVPSVITASVEPGRASMAVAIISDISSDADVLLRVLPKDEQPPPGTAGWLQVLNGHEQTVIPAITGQYAIDLAVRHMGISSCGADQLCGAARTVETVLWLEVRAQPLPSVANTSFGNAVSVYNELLELPVRVTVASGSANAASSRSFLPSARTVRVGGRSSLLALPQLDGSVLNTSMVPADTAGAVLVLPSSQFNPLAPLAVQSFDAGGSTVRPSRSIPRWAVLRNVADLQLRFSGSTTITSVLAAGKVVGPAALSSSLGGRLLPNGPTSALVLRPQCPVPSQRLAPDQLSCTCAGGYQISANFVLDELGVPNPSMCEICPAGKIKPSNEFANVPCSDCPAGTFSNLAGTACVQCPVNGVNCLGGTVTPRDGFWCDTCVLLDTMAPSHPAVRSRRSAELDTALARNGYTVASYVSSARRSLSVTNASSSHLQSLGVSLLTAESALLVCQPAEACLRATNGSDIRCADGHRGVLCGECMEGWARSSAEFLCTECPTGQSALIESVLASALTTALVMYLALKTEKTPTEAEPEGSERAAANVYIGLFRILISWGQTLGVLRAARLPPRSMVDSALSFVSSMAVGVSPNSATVQCAIRVSFYYRLAGAMLLPIAALVLPLVLCNVFFAFRRKPSKKKFPRKSIENGVRDHSSSIQAANYALSPPQNAAVNSDEPTTLDDTSVTICKPQSVQMAGSGDDVLASGSLSQASMVSAAQPKRRTKAAQAWGTGLPPAAPPSPAHHDFSEFYDSFDYDFADGSDEDGVTAVSFPTFTLAEMTTLRSAQPTPTPRALATSALASSGVGAAAAIAATYTSQKGPASPDVMLSVRGVTKALASAAAPHRARKRVHRSRRMEVSLRTALILLLLFHFGVVETCLRVLDTLDTTIFGFEYMRSDVSVGSFHGADFALAQLVALVGLGLWGFGIPLAGACVMCRNRHQLRNPEVKALYGSLYDGVQIGPSPTELAAGQHVPNYWYWELLIVVPRKLLLAVAVSVIRQPYAQACFILAVLTAALVVQAGSQPYTARALNVVETLALGVLWLSAAAGIVLSRENSISSNLELFVTSLVATANVLFVLGTLLVVFGAAAADLVSAKEETQDWLQAYTAKHKPQQAAEPVPGCLTWPCSFGCRRGCMAWGVRAGLLDVSKAMRRSGDAALIPRK